MSQILNEKVKIEFNHINKIELIIIIIVAHLTKIHH